MSKIGEPQKEIVVEPVTLPDRHPQEQPAEPVQPVEPVKVPA